MKVLMLGWEFPPFFSGGLGIATYGMVKALSPKVNIRLIVPNAGEQTLSNVNVVGLNSLTAEQLTRDTVREHGSSYAAETVRIPFCISPYHHINEVIERHEASPWGNETTTETKVASTQRIFQSKEVYGFNIKYKIHLYTQLVHQLEAGGNFDLIHANDWITFPAGMQLRKSTQKPLLLHVHSLETDRSGTTARNEIYDLEKEAMMTADGIFAVSEYTRDQIIRHYHIPLNKIRVVHNGIEPAINRKVKHALRDKLVVFLGRITHQKGPEFLLETAEKVTRVFQRVKFVVAGTGDQFAHLLETSAYKRLGRKFIFAGFLTKAKVDELLGMADVYFMPSVSEPFGLTALEAAQHGVPSVLSKQSGASEVIKASLKADFWDTDKYANYIHALLKYKVLHQQLSKAAHDELDGLTWEYAAEKIMTVYQQFYSLKH